MSTCFLICGLLIENQWIEGSIASAPTKFQWFSSLCAPSALHLNQPAVIRGRKFGEA